MQMLKLLSFIIVVLLPSIGICAENSPLIQINGELITLPKALTANENFVAKKNDIFTIKNSGKIINFDLKNEHDIQAALVFITGSKIRINLELEDVIKNSGVFLDENKIADTSSSGKASITQLYLDPGEHKIVLIKKQNHTIF